VQQVDLPSGTFSLLHGQGHEVGQAVVRHPAVQAVGFTGSHTAGRALCDVAAARVQPIPVFAEMGSANPVVILPRALAARGPAIAERLAAAALLAQGQFCTSPGLWLWIDAPGADVFAAALRERFRAAESLPGVHPSVRRGFHRALAEVGALPVQVAASGLPAGDPAQATALRPTLLRASADARLAHERLGSEIYGPAVLGVACRDEPEMLRVVASLHGHLTATVHGDGDDFVRFGPVVHALRQKAGRLVANGVPTGVEVSPAMVHGGPWPASSDPRYTAVGTPSIGRRVRPVCWQDWPHDQLPPQLQDDNPRGVGRIVDGVWRRATRS
jgi:NADP-dependent aldehyde dehydrogenase